MFKATKIVLPKIENNILKFTDYSLTMEFEYIGNLDFETKITSVNNYDRTNKTIKYQEHEACSFCFIILDKNAKIVYDFLYRGPNAAKIFLEKQNFQKLYLGNNNIIPMKNLTNEQLENHEKYTHCHICNGIFLEYKIKVFDHDHLNGDYRGSAHVICNINYQVKKELPIYVHNLKNFDANLILKQLSAEDFRKSNYTTNNSIIYFIFF